MPNPLESPNINTDHLIIGAGIAGLKLALKLAELGSVTMIMKSHDTDNNSWHAQGGVASVLSPTDQFENHIADTLNAGAGLCHQDIVEEVVRKGPQLIRELIAYGVHFTRDEQPESTPKDFHLTKEGGHSHRRVIHADDLTGREIIRALLTAVRHHPQITLMENQFAIDLITSDRFAPRFDHNQCLGAYVLNRTTGGIYCIASKQTYLCTGGHGKVYLYTSNPDSATGDGLAMAWRAGCRIANLEFMQFHPTCLYHSQAKNFLISEALRGEGAVLKNEAGEEFVKQYHEWSSLAPRDIVARAIDSELKKTGAPCVYLDARHLGAKRISKHFPNIYQKCLEYDIDITTMMIPIVPAAHYSCGGIVVNNLGQTNIGNLYALGEVACTGLHGANRLASNSLLEALVFANIVGEQAAIRASADDEDSPRQSVHKMLPAWDFGDAVASDEICVINHLWDEIRRSMWNYVGIVRTTKRLERALSRMRSLRSEINHYYWNNQITASILEVRNLADVAFLTVNCAMARKESRGIHYSEDYPTTHLDQPIDTILSNII